MLSIFVVCLFFALMDLVLLKTVLSNPSVNEESTMKLSVHPSSGSSTDNIEVRCEVSSPPLISPLASTTFENIYLSVKTDGVIPSGILLMFDDRSDRCEKNRDNVQIDVCNASLVLYQ